MKDVNKLNTKLIEYKNKLNILRKELKEKEIETNKIYKKVKSLQEEVDSLTLTEEDVGKLLLCYPESQIKFDLLRKITAKYNLGIGGYFPETNQYNIQISSIDDSNINNIEKGIMYFMPYLKKIKSSKIISITDKDLSVYGVYYLEIYDDKFILSKTTYSRRNVEFKHKKLITVLQYIQKNIM